MVGVGHVVVFLVRHPAEGAGDAMRHDFAVQGLLARRRYRLDAPDSRETVPVTGGRRPGAEVYVGDRGPYPVTLAWSSRGEFLDACRALAPPVEPTGFLVRDHYAVSVEDGECRVAELDGRPWTEVLVSQCPPDAAWSLLLHEPRACVRGERPVREGVLDQARAALAVAPEVSSGSAAHEAGVLAARLLLLLGRPEEAVPYAEETAYADGCVPARVRADAYGVLGRVWEHAGEGHKALEAVDWLLAALVVGPSLEATARAEPGLATLCADPRVRARLDAVAGSRPPRPRAPEALWHHGYHKGEHHPLPYPFHTHLVETGADVADLLAVLGEGDDEVLLIDADAPTRQSAGHSLSAAVAHGFTYFCFSDPGHRAWWTVGDRASPPHSPHWWDTRYPPGSGLPASRAATVIREFLDTGARPTCVRWSRRD